MCVRVCVRALGCALQLARRLASAEDRGRRDGEETALLAEDKLAAEARWAEAEQRLTHLQAALGVLPWRAHTAVSSC